MEQTLSWRCSGKQSSMAVLFQVIYSDYFTQDSGSDEFYWKIKGLLGGCNVDAEIKDGSRLMRLFFFETGSHNLL